MLDIVGEKENEDKKLQSNSNELFDIINENGKSFSRKLEFVGLDYEAKREKVEDTNDEIIKILSNENFLRLNAFMKIIKEIIKNSADHNDNYVDISLDILRNERDRKLLIKFVVLDHGKGLVRNEEDILKIFNEEIEIENRSKKGNKNFGIGLGIIKSGAKYFNIDLTLHNKGKTIKINDLGKNTKPRDENDFGYEGYGIFDLIPTENSLNQPNCTEQQKS